jgi:hypothetical protein
MIVVLCEDIAQGNLVRHFAKHCGLVDSPTRQVVIKPCSSGCGFDHVIRELPAEISELRSKAVASKLLVACIDCDTDDNNGRMRAFASSIANAGLSPISNTERVLFLFPQRNIETWIFALANEQHADPASDYKRAVRNVSVKNQAARLAELCQRREQPDWFPESLIHACAEYNRLLR